MDDVVGGAYGGAPAQVALDGEVLPPGHQEALNPYVACSMIHSFATSLYGASYEKDANRFAMNIEDALEASTGMFIKAFDMDLVRRRFAKVSDKLAATDLLMALVSNQAALVPPAETGKAAAAFDFG